MIEKTKKIKKIILLLGLTFISQLSFSQTMYFGGSISSDTIWNSDTVQITGNVTINDSATLTISPGTYVEFQGFYSFKVEGRLLAVGNNTDTIIFTIKDTTGYSVDSVSIGAWAGIQFYHIANTNDTSKISYCKLQYIKCNTVILIESSFKVIIEHDYFSNILAYGVINCQYSSSLINFNKFSNCICISSDSSGVMFDSIDIIYLYKSSSIIANNNINIFSSGEPNSVNYGIICSECFQPVEITNNTISAYGSIGTNKGFGISCLFSNPTIYNNYINCNNLVTGIYCGDSSSSLISNNIITNNAGGIICGNSSPVIIQNIISNNTADGGGGIKLTGNANPTIIFNKISNNYSNATGCGISDGGGGIFIVSSSPKIINNIICNNSSIGQGGGIYCFDTICNPLIVNNTIANNSANIGGGFFTWGTSWGTPNPTIINSIFWGNIATQSGDQIYIQNSGNLTTISYCDVDTIEGNMGFTGIFNNNIKTNPLFVNPSSGAGLNYNGLLADWNLMGNSPCINTGDPDTTGLFLRDIDIDGNNRIIDGIIDIGAYENGIIESIQEIANYYELMIFPNPSNDKITIERPIQTNDMVISIYNIQGQLLLDQLLKQKKTDINISDFAKGLYFVKVKTDKGITTNKFIKD
jgi:parallel beta-helix repeat protein